MAGGILSAERIGLLLVLAATFSLYAPTVSYQFVYDDHYQILQNPHLRSWQFLPVYFSQSMWSQLGNSDTNLYRPLFLLWLRLQMAVFGAEPAGWHLTTVLLHVLATGLVYLLARRLLRSYAAALAAALVFGVHPIHTEAVAWVSGVPEPLSAALLLGSLLCYLHRGTAPNHRGTWLASSLVLFAAAVLVKETATVLPLLIVAYELTVGEQHQLTLDSYSRLRRAGFASIPYFAVLGGYFLLRAFAMGRLHPGTVPLRTSLLSVPWLAWTYVRMLLWPSGLSPSYDFPYVEHVSLARFALPLAGLVAAVAALWWRSRRSQSRLAWFLSGWLVITLAPVLAAFCLAYAEESVHDRYLYLPSVALALLAGAVVACLNSSRALPIKVALAGLAAMTLIALAAGTARQVRYWQSNYTLFQRATEIAPRNERAALNFDAELIKTREYRRALALCQRMIALHPDSERPEAAAAQAAFLLQDYPLAESYYAQATRMDGGQGDLFYFLGLTRMRQGNYSGAADALHSAVARSPRAPFFHYTLGVTLARLQNWREAREQFSQELQLQAPASSIPARQALLDADRHLHGKAANPETAEPAKLDVAGVPD